jgi:hypothetical protein
MCAVSPVLESLKYAFEFPNKLLCNATQYIQGFLRRVHRWPILLPDNSSPHSIHSLSRQRGISFTASNISFTPPESSPVLPDEMPSRDLRDQRTEVAPAISPVKENGALVTIKPSAAETVLERLRTRDMQKSGSFTSPRSSRIVPSRDDGQDGRSGARRQSVVTSPSSSLLFGSNVTPQSAYVPPSPIPSRPRLLRTPSVPIIPQVPAPATASPSSALPYPAELPLLLDGEHHTDELAVRFDAGWPLMVQWLVAVGGGDGIGEFGRVLIIYR